MSRVVGRTLTVVPVLLLAGVLTGCHSNGAGGRVTSAGGDGHVVYTQLIAGTSSELQVSDGVGGIELRDLKAGLQAGTGCTQINPHRVVCEDPSLGIILVMGDGNDIVRNTSLEDTFINGGPGNDTAVGGEGSETFVDGTELDSDSYDGGNQLDFVSYELGCSDGGGVTVTLNAAADDGCLTEGDNVAFTVEGIIGSPQADVLTADDNHNNLEGRGGADILTAAGGNDLLLGEAGFDTLDGGADNDICDVGADSGIALNCES